MSAAITAAVAAGFAAMVAFVVLYSWRSAWRSTPTGRNLMALPAVLGGTITGTEAVGVVTAAVIAVLVLLVPNKKAGVTPPADGSVRR